MMSDYQHLFQVDTTERAGIDDSVVVKINGPYWGLNAEGIHTLEGHREWGELCLPKEHSPEFLSTVLNYLQEWETSFEQEGGKRLAFEMLGEKGPALIHPVSPYFSLSPLGLTDSVYLGRDGNLLADLTIKTYPQGTIVTVRKPRPAHHPRLLESLGEAVQKAMGANGRFTIRECDTVVYWTWQFFAREIGRRARRPPWPDFSARTIWDLASEHFYKERQ